MSSQLFILGTGIIIITVLFHVFGLLALASALKNINSRLSNLHKAPLTATLLSISVFGVLAIHILEAWAWAAVYIKLGEFEKLETALYFSIVTSTTLGFGDIVLSDQWRLLSTFEAMGGLVLFGTSTAFLLGMMRHLFEFSD